MVLNEELCKMFDEINKRLCQEFEMVKNDKWSSWLDKYIGGYIISAMTQYKESVHLERHSNETQIKALYNYEKSNNLLRDIIDFTIKQEESGRTEYPLLLDYGYAYDMVIDFIDNIDKESIDKI